MAKNNFIEATGLVNGLNEVFNKHIGILETTTQKLVQLNLQYAKLPSEYIKAQNTILANNQKLQKSSASLKQRTSEEIVNQRLLAQAADTQTKANSRLAGAWLNLNAKLSIAEKRYRNLAASQGLSNKATIRAQAEVNKLRKQIDAINGPIGRMNNNVGNYPKLAGGVRQLMSAFGLVGGVYMFAAAVKDAFDRMKQFDQANADLASVLGKTKAEVKDLTDEAIRLGAATVYTATQVSEFQTNLARLGFDTSQIKGMTEASLNLATALGGDLAATAELVGSSLRGMNEDFTQSTRYADVMAKATNISALNFERLSNALPYVTAQASQAGFSFEKLTGILGILVNRGLDAETAGAGLRNVFLEIAKRGLTLEEALNDVNNATDRGAKSMELFDKRGATLGLILADNIDQISEFENILNQSGGTVDFMAKTQLDTLGNQLKILDSAWEKLILTMDRGDGAFSKFMKGAFSNGAVQIDRLSFIIDNNTSAWEKWMFVTNNTTKSLSYIFPFMEKGTGLFEDDIKVLIENTEERNKSIAAIQEQTDAFIALNGSIAPLVGPGQKPFNFMNFGGDASAQVEQVRTLARINEEIAAQQQLISNGNLSTREEAKVIQDKIVALEKERDAILGSKKAKEKDIKAVEGSIAAMQKNISKLEEQRDKLATNTKEYAAMNAKVYDATAALELFTMAAGKVDTSMPELDKNAFFESFEEEVFKKMGPAAEQAFKQFADSVENGNDAVKRLQDSTDAFLSSFTQDMPLQSIAQMFDGTFQKLFAGAETFEEKFAVTFNAIGEIAQETYAFIDQITQANFERDMYRLEQQRDISIAYAGDSAAAREEIERQTEEKRRAIQRKQAQSQKRAAIFNAIINTAQAIVGTLAQTPPPAGIPLAIAMGVIGAAQIAVIAAQKIPEFREGVRGFAGGPAIVGDGGVSEVVETNKGTFTTPSKDTLVNLPKGANVYKNRQEFFNEKLNELLTANMITPLGDSMHVPDINVDGLSYEDMDRVMGKYFKNLQTTQTILDKKGFNQYIKKGNASTVKMNNRVTGKGLSV